jgi:hypothetical protein
MTVKTRVMTCRGCDRTVEVPDPDNDGHPYGWYSLSVRMPLELNGLTRKPFRWVGMFCSIECLMGHGPQLIAWQKRMADQYERE